MIGSVVLWIFFPDTRGMALEEIAALFGDQDEIAVYQRDIVIDPDRHDIIEGDEKVKHVLHREDIQSVQV